jgi:hypothetical protein
LVFKSVFWKEKEAMNIEAIENEIQEKGLNAPRITQQDIEANIKQEYFFTAAQGAFGAHACDSTDCEIRISAEEFKPRFPLDLLTFCVLELKNGFTVTGESACVSPKNFDVEIGKKIARQNAIAKIWPLMGYELRNRLADLSTSK